MVNKSAQNVPTKKEIGKESREKKECRGREGESHELKGYPSFVSQDTLKHRLEPPVLRVSDQPRTT